MEYTSGIEIKWDAVAPWKSEKKWKCYPYIKQEEILNYWANKIKFNNSYVFENTAYIDSSVNQDGVLVKCVDTTNSEEIMVLKGKLIIDASGYSSQIVKQKRIDRKNFFWWSVYGYELEFENIEELKHPGNLGNMKIGDYMLWQSFGDFPMNNKETLSELRPIMEYEVLDEKTVFVFILYYCDEIIDKDFMQNQFETILKNETSISTFTKGKKSKERFGWYPSSGIVQKMSKDRMAFVGDSGCWTIPAGWGMSFILQNYKKYAENISENIVKDKLNARELNKAVTFNTKEKYEILMDKLVLHFLSYAKPELIDKFTKTVFEAFGGERLEIMFCLQMSKKESFQTMLIVLKKFKLKELFGIFHNFKDYILILEVIVLFMASSFIDLVRKIFRIKPENAGFKYRTEREEK